MKKPRALKWRSHLHNSPEMDSPNLFVQNVIPQASSGKTNREKLKTALKVILPSILAAIKIFQHAALGEATQGIFIGSALGSLAILIFWRKK